ncbi:LuxR C-terminal-related transcriptional regulator [Virgibacillus kekensis]|uniref:LuxR C-terminal-related transcriptional regulator n=1 Tax=Virgibacillus kekensis TaxID=202261 RepID=A0ABV9DFW6_9BACI
MRQFELLEEVLEFYAERYKLTVITTDKEGDSVLPVKGENPLSNIFLCDKTNGLSAVIARTLREAKNIKSPLVYELWPGIHTIIAPFVPEDGKMYFIWAGLMVEQETNHLVLDQLKEKYPDIHNWEDILAQTPMLTAKNKADWLKRISKLIRLAGTPGGKNDGSSSFGEYNQLLSIAFQKEELELTPVLNEFLAKGKEFDFMGYAAKQDDESYIVTDVSGKAAQGLKGAGFSVGEGFLGRVLVTGEQEYWDSISKDPRTYFFTRNGLSPATLFCFPITRHDGSLALFFGGNVTAMKENGRMEFARTLATILEKSLLTDALRDENTQQFQRLSSLVEICKMMVSRPEYKRIIYILVDISLSLMEGPFSCMILKDPKTGKMKLVSRGAQNESMGEYAQDVIDRYYSGVSMESKDVSLKTADDATKWGSPVIECPLYYKSVLLGILCVGTNSPDGPQLSEDRKFLQTLSSIGGVTLKLAMSEEEDTEETQVNTLYQAIRQFDNEAYNTAETASDLAEKFSEKLELSLWSSQAIMNSCKLYHYDVEFIREILPGSRIADIVENTKGLLDGIRDWEDLEVESRVVAIIISYMKNNLLDAVTSLTNGVQDEMVSKFISYIHRSQMIEEDFFTVEDGGEEATDEFITFAIKELNISPREQEVLDLVIRGFNNREIGEKLFISSHTVKNHVTRIFQKLGVQDRAHAISKVYQLKYQKSN